MTTAQDGGKVVSLTRRPPLLLFTRLYTFVYYLLGISALCSKAMFTYVFSFLDKAENFKDNFIERFDLLISEMPV